MKSEPSSPPVKTALALRIWRSFFPAPLLPQSERDGRFFLRRNLILHFRPATVKAKTLPFTLTWGLGGMAVTLVLMQGLTGILLKFVYVATPMDAYQSIQDLIWQVPFGRLIRNLHYWGANLLTIVTFLHMLRVMFSGAFYTSRRSTWALGLMLFALVLTANLSGYLLPYDQLAYWAVTVVTATLDYIPVIGQWLQQRLGGGSGLATHTLSFFFAVHTAVIPLLLTVLLGFHFWRIRRAGGLVVPRNVGEDVDDKPSRLPSVPHLLVREVTVALILVALMLVGAVFFDAPLAAPANPGMSPNPVRAPWYFAGFQELLLLFHPTVAVSLIPPLAGLFLLSIPYMGYRRSTEGIWFASPMGRKLSVAAAGTALAVMPLLIVVDDWMITAIPWAASMPPSVRDGVIPLVFFLAVLAGYLVVLKKRAIATKNDAVQSIFVFMVTGYVVLTVVGLFFRGPAMKLVWPF